VQGCFKDGWNLSKKTLLTIPTRFDYFTTLMNIIETFASTPLLVTLQHMLDAFMVLAPVVGLIGITFILTQNK